MVGLATWMKTCGFGAFGFCLGTMFACTGS